MKKISENFSVRISTRNLSGGNTTTGSLSLGVSHQLKRSSIYTLTESNCFKCCRIYLSKSNIFIRHILANLTALPWKKDLQNMDLNTQNIGLFRDKKKLIFYFQLMTSPVHWTVLLTVSTSTPNKPVKWLMEPNVTLTKWICVSMENVWYVRGTAT